MPVLGYGQVSGIAPGLFQDAGDSIVAGIRRTGQEIRKNLQTVQVNKQVNAFGQEAATLDPRSPNYSTALAGLQGKYPLAAGSDAGKLMSEVLTLENRNSLLLNRDRIQHGYDLEMERERAKRTGADGSGGSLSGRFRRIPGLGLVDVLTKEVVAAEPGKTRTLNEGQALVDEQGNVLAEPRARTTATPYRFGGGVVGNAATGEFEPLPMTPFQEGTLGQRAQVEDRTRAVATIRALDDDIARSVQEMEKTQDEGRILDLKNRIDRARSEKDTLLNVFGGVPIQGPSAGANNPMAPRVLGGMNPPAIATDPMDLGGSVPSVLPPLDAIGPKRTIDRETAKKILQEVGGDRQKARARAAEMGYIP
jgi:hypothetical protein